MNKIFGKVLVKENGIGIPNLIVLVYDLDPDYQTENIATLASWYPAGAGGDRIGAVITDEKGYFELQYDDADYQVTGSEKRPDLFVFVLAPEDTISEEQPTSLPPQRRLLHSSSVPRGNAGRTEGYVIRLLAVQLEKAGIPLPEEFEKGIPEIDPLLLSLDASFALENAVQGKLNQQLSKKIAWSKEAGRRAREAFMNFYPSSVPEELRSDPTYFAPGDVLKTSQEKIFRRDIDRLRAVGEKHTLQLRLTKKELEQVGYKTKADGSQAVNLKNLFHHVERKNKGASFQWANSPLLPCKEVVTASKIISEITQPTYFADELGEEGEIIPLDEHEDPDLIEIPENDATELTAEELVKDLVSRHMEHVTPAEAYLKFGIPERAQQGDVTASINALEIKGGPADVTAYHDFHNLQVAFEHVWKEEFDAFLRGWGTVIYEQWIGQKKAFAIDDEPDVTIESLDGLIALLNNIADEQDTLEEVNDPPWIVTNVFWFITPAQWSRLDGGVRLNIVIAANSVYGTAGEEREAIEKVVRELIEENERNVAQEQLKPKRNKIAARESSRSRRVKRLIDDLKSRIAEPHKFDIFAPDSINYGILVTYRQQWEPLNYQVGELVSTIPLAPKETRRYTKKRIYKKSRAQKEIEDSLRIIGRDAAETRRADAEIVNRAVSKTNYRAAAEGSGRIGIAEVSGSTGLEVQAEKMSSQTKKDFREAVLKTAEEYKQEHHLEVESTESEQFEESTSGEITNPNDELTVTYLLYELQRRYEIQEKIHRLTPVILVACEMPAPHEIDEDWLLSYDWILSRVILDDSFLVALDSLKFIAGAELALDVLQTNVEQQSAIVEDLKGQIELKKEMLGKTFEDVKKAKSKQARAAEEEDSEGIFESIGEGLFGGGRGESQEAQRIRAERAQMAFEQVERELQELQAQLSREVTALEAATKEYTSALREDMDRKTEISRLRIHIKENILHYMQAIWEHEPPDHRFFRLYNKDAIWIPVPDDIDIRIEDGELVDIDFDFFPLFMSIDFKTLVEIADLDNLLGFKGNYMIFPLKQNNFITWYMMQPYLDDAWLRDPEKEANYTTEELIENFSCRYNQDPDAFTEDDLEHWRNLILERLMARRREKDIVIVPTNSLYIEALPGKHPLLEDFKLAHRALDVKKVQAETRHDELENVRIAARLLSGEREDPDIEKKVVIEGDGQGIIVHDDE